MFHRRGRNHAPATLSAEEIPLFLAAVRNVSRVPPISRNRWPVVSGSPEERKLMPYTRVWTPRRTEVRLASTGLKFPVADISRMIPPGSATSSTAWRLGIAGERMGVDTVLLGTGLSAG